MESGRKYGQICLILICAAPFVFGRAVYAQTPIEPTLTENLDQLDQNTESAEQESEDCDPETEDCSERKQTAEDLKTQKDENQKALESINERLKNSGYKVEGIDQTGNLKITDSKGNSVKKLGEAELGYSKATRDGNLIERYGKTDQGLTVETVRDANGKVTDIRINEFNGDSTGRSAGPERSLTSIDSTQLADLNVDATTSGPVIDQNRSTSPNVPTPKTTTDSGATSTSTSTSTTEAASTSNKTSTGTERGLSRGVEPSSSEANSGQTSGTDATTATSKPEPTLLDTALAKTKKSITSAQQLYDDTLAAANDFISELSNPVEQPKPVVQAEVQAKLGYVAKGSDGKTVYSVSDSRITGQDRIAIVVDSNDANVGQRLDLARNSSVYDAYIKTSNLNDASVKEFIARYPGHRVDIMTHGFSEYNGGIQSGPNSFMYAGSDSMTNFFSGVNNEVCLYACSVGASLYNTDGTLNTQSFQYQISSLTHAPITAADRPTYAGGYQSAGTNRYTLTVPAAVNPYPNLYSTMSQHSGTFQAWGNIFSTLSLYP
ncbi:MAG: hypothetical protein R3B54_17595 [Bdellovibrionota bacterium]